MSGIIIGILFNNIVWFICRKYRNRKLESNPEQRPTEVDTIYQELDLSKMNKDHYQSLIMKGNTSSNDAENDGNSYTELNKVGDVKNNYQVLIQTTS